MNAYNKAIGDLDVTSIYRFSYYGSKVVQFKYIESKNNEVSL